MASREKKPLASSKSKQSKTNNDASLSSSPSRSNKNSNKNKSLPSQLFETVTPDRNNKSAIVLSSTLYRFRRGPISVRKSTGSIDRRISRLRSVPSLIDNKSSITTSTTTTTDNIGLDTSLYPGRRPKVSARKSCGATENYISRLRSVPSLNDNKSSTNIVLSNLKPKDNNKEQSIEVDGSLIDKNSDSTSCSSTSSTITSQSNSPKSNKKLKTVSPESQLKSAKVTNKLSERKKSVGKESLEDLKYLKTRKSSPAVVTTASEVKNSGKLKNSIDSTIDEVVAMVSDTEIEELAPVDPDNKLEGKITRSKKMLIEECDIKKELVEPEEEIKSDDEGAETLLKANQSSRRRMSQRSLRNGKLRQLDSTEEKKARRHADDETDNADDEPNNVESGQSEATENERDAETENNNNSEQVDRSVDGEAGGPNLRSKAKAKSTDTPITGEDISTIDSKTTTTTTNPAEEPIRKSSGFDLLKKDNCLLGKITIGDKQSLKARRSSLNIDVKKTMGPLYGSEKIDGVSPQSKLDKMVEDIKLNIAKSIESKIGSDILSLDKSLGITKNFDTPKIEEVVAPFNTSMQKIGVLNKITNDDEETKADGSKIQIATNSSTTNNSNNSNSVPKVADTAKEIEKLVMGDNIEDNQHISESAETSKNKDANDETALIKSDSAKKSHNEPDQSQSSSQSSESLLITATTEVVVEEVQEAVKREDKEEEDQNQEKEKEKEKEKEEEEKDTVCSNDEKVSGEELKEEKITVKPCESMTKETEEETLETISMEVERLVTEPLPSNLNDTQSNESEEDKNLEMDVELPENIVEAAENNEQVVKIQDVVKSNDQTNLDSEVIENVSLEESTMEIVEESVVNEEEIEDDIKLTTEIDDNDYELIEKVGDQVTEVKQEVKNEEKQKSVSPEPSLISQEENTNKTSEKAVASAIGIEVKSREEKSSDINKSGVEEGRRVLRARDKLRKSEKALKAAEASGEAKSDDLKINKASTNETGESTGMKSKDETETAVVVKIEEPEPITRGRRSREVKKRKELETSPQSLKSKRSRRDNKKLEQQKEETLLDNEVATINENKRSLSVDKLSKRIEGTKSLRVFSPSESARDKNNDNRSKSENDIETSKVGKTERLSRGRCDSIKPKESSVNPAAENVLKDSDEASTSGESTSSVSFKILETPEEKVRKESILRMLGLESMEKAAERLEKAKREQYTGTLKTIIRVSKDKDKDKKQSRSPLKMVLKQGRNDGDGGDTSEFYTIQKELGTSGLGDSSSGANRKLSTNHRQSCDEEHEDISVKTRPRLIIPEKYSSFSIHPGRPCADVCCYCFGKFGSLDTPMHLAQLKSDERREKILSAEGHLTTDSCLCDACYRHVDRKANMSPTNTSSKPQRVHRQLLVSKCNVKDCRNPARHTVKRRWIQKIKPSIQNQMKIDVTVEPNQHSSMYFCVDHYALIEKFLICALCTRRLTRNQAYVVTPSETNELNRLLEQQRVPVLVTSGTFLCKLCRYFVNMHFKFKDVESMKANNKAYCKSYRKRLLEIHNIDVTEDEDDELPQQGLSMKDKRKKSKNSLNKSGSSFSVDNSDKSTSEKSTPEPVKSNPPATSQIDDTVNRDSDEQHPKASVTDDDTTTETQILDLESAVEKLKKRKALDQHLYSTTSPVFNNHNNNSNNNNNNSSKLQRPYGNQSSFLRHLILLEKYYRSGDLVLAPNASRNAINYSTSVQNRLISYEGPEKVDEPITDPLPNEFSNSRRLSGGYLLERDRLATSTPSTSSLITTPPITTATPDKLSLSQLLQQQQQQKQQTQSSQQLNTKSNPPRIFKINTGVSIIKKPPPSLQRLNLPSSSGSNSSNSNIMTNSTANGSAKRKDGFPNKITGSTSGGKVIHMSEPDFKRLQSLKKQKMLSEKITTTSFPSATSTSTSTSLASLTNSLAVTNVNATNVQQLKSAQTVARQNFQFHEHIRMQQEMLNRQSRGDFEPLICDVRSLINENTPTQNLINNLNLPKSIQVTTKPPSNNPIPILPKIPKSLTVIPQTIHRTVDK
ncbi:GSCOCG00006361001-RA-CDS [Cotesia congregata]|nr:GSCOCG00006361001-RA-CDS [Cotesia congregata]